MTVVVHGGGDGGVEIVLPPESVPSNFYCREIP